MTEVCILGVMHGLHKENNAYSYNEIFEVIDKFSPEVIGIEIRPEDIGESVQYLEKFYPYEMVQTKIKYKNKCKIYGFDWFEEKVEGKLLGDDYFSSFDKVKIEKEFEVDDKYKREKKVLEVIDDMRLELLLNHNAKEVNDGKYDVIANVYYKEFEVLFKDTPYERMAEIFNDRQARINENIVSIIKENMGKRLLFITGIDHRIFILDAIKENVKEGIKFTAV